MSKLIPFYHPSMLISSSTFCDVTTIFTLSMNLYNHFLNYVLLISHSCNKGEWKRFEYHHILLLTGRLLPSCYLEMKNSERIYWTWISPKLLVNCHQSYSLHPVQLLILLAFLSSTHILHQRSFKNPPSSISIITPWTLPNIIAM